MSQGGDPVDVENVEFWVLGLGFGVPPGTLRAREGTQLMTKVYMAPSKKDWRRPRRRTRLLEFGVWG